ncbi:MAG: hypothetical protein NWE79_04530 [Candidatus Bathyarchaeota archaeon]|nr:hypothetical protein [Candidatus Bathyarchaeota archaeon]
MAERIDKVAFVCHCVVNQSARAWWGEVGASRESGMMSDAIGVLVSQGVGAIQMDCPEFSLYGNPRPPRSTNEYDTPEFRNRCREIASRACDQMECLLERGRDPRIELVAVIGLENSPSCGVERTTRTVDGRRVSAPGRGLLIEALDMEMLLRGIDAPFISLSLRADERAERLDRLEALCMGA